jgi:hypothetical protein
MSGARLEGAVKLALEDRLVTPVSSLTVVNTPQTGGVLVRWADTTLLKNLATAGFTRAFSEADLCDLTPDSWSVCVADDGDGFLRRDDGSTLACHIPPNAAMPAVLTLAIKQAEKPPTSLRLQLPGAAAVALDWQTAFADIALKPDHAWRWQNASLTAFAQAVNLMPAPAKPKFSFAHKSRWVLAAKILAAALFLHIGATTIAWGTTVFERWQVQRGWSALAKTAGIPTASSIAQTEKALSRAYAKLAHKAGHDAPTDAMPLLAQMAPALETLPKSAVKRLTYMDGAWTLECQTLPTNQAKSLETAFKRAGFSTFGGANAGGYKLRVEPGVFTP